MTTATLSAAAAPTFDAADKACLRHGPLSPDASCCPRCGASVYRLADEGDRATLKSFRKAWLKARIGTCATVGGVVAQVAYALFVAGHGLFAFNLQVIAVGAAVGMAVEWAARTPGQHRLDKQLGL